MNHQTEKVGAFQRALHGNGIITQFSGDGGEGRVVEIRRDSVTGFWPDLLHEFNSAGDITFTVVKDGVIVSEPGTIHGLELRETCAGDMDMSRSRVMREFFDALYAGMLIGMARRVATGYSGYCCPACGDNEHLANVGHCLFLLTVQNENNDGRYAIENGEISAAGQDGDIEWDDTSYMTCRACDFQGVMAEFDTRLFGTLETVLMEAKFKTAHFMEALISALVAGQGALDERTLKLSGVAMDEASTYLDSVKSKQLAKTNRAPGPA